MQADENEVVFQKILRRLIQTGEWERLKSILTTALDDSGWSREMQQSYRDQAVSSSEAMSISALSHAMSGHAHKLLARDVRDRISAILKECVQRHYETS